MSDATVIAFSAAAAAIVGSLVTSIPQILVALSTFRASTSAKDAAVTAAMLARATDDKALALATETAALRTLTEAKLQALDHLRIDLGVTTGRIEILQALVESIASDRRGERTP